MSFLPRSPAVCARKYAPERAVGVMRLHAVGVHPLGGDKKEQTAHRRSTHGGLTLAQCWGGHGRTLAEEQCQRVMQGRCWVRRWMRMQSRGWGRYTGRRSGRGSGGWCS
jgi:hypothetical protein